MDDLRTVAALYVQRNGVYAGVPGVDPWDEQRDARLYAGPHPVVAHPPCSRWCKLAGLVEKRWGHKKGDDGGCFAAALASVRKWGGVLEHPAFTRAWSAYDLPDPPTSGWQRTLCGGYVCQVSQNKYGHPAAKPTWLYSFGVDPPALRWGDPNEGDVTALVSWCANTTKPNEARQRVGKAVASRSPLEFRDVLIAMARSSVVVARKAVA